MSFLNPLRQKYPLQYPHLGTFAMSGNLIAANRSTYPEQWTFTAQLGVCRRQHSSHSRHPRTNPDHFADDIDRLSLNTVPAWISGMVGEDRNAIFGRVQSDPPDERL